MFILGDEGRSVLALAGVLMIGIAQVGLKYERMKSWEVLGKSG